jgi:hypothetical protein
MPCRYDENRGPIGLHGMQEVAGSSPASSTRRTPAHVGVSSFQWSVCRMRIVATVPAVRGSPLPPPARADVVPPTRSARRATSRWRQRWQLGGLTIRRPEMVGARRPRSVHRGVAGAGEVRDLVVAEVVGVEQELAALAPVEPPEHPAHKSGLELGRRILCPWRASRTSRFARGPSAGTPAASRLPPAAGKEGPS